MMKESQQKEVWTFVYTLQSEKKKKKEENIYLSLNFSLQVTILLEMQNIISEWELQKHGAS